MAPNYSVAKAKAAKLLSSYGITHPPVDPEAIAEDMGLRVVYARFNPDVAGSISGFLDPAKNRIVVNLDIPSSRKTFTIAHELAHHLLHAEYAKSDTYEVSGVFNRLNEYENQKPDAEREADVFAANLLVPEDMLKEYKDIASHTELARMFCVSPEVITHRLKWVK